MKLRLNGRHDCQTKLRYLDAKIVQKLLRVFIDINISVRLLCGCTTQRRLGNNPININDDDY